MRYLVVFSLGVATGLLIAPDNGEKNFQKAKEKFNELSEKLEEQLKGEDEDDR